MRGADVERLHALARVARDRRAVDEAEAIAIAREPVERQVGGERHRRHAALAMAIFGYDADACGRQGSGRQARHRRAADAKPALGGRAHSREHGDEVALAVALDAGDADDLAAM